MSPKNILQKFSKLEKSENFQYKSLYKNFGFSDFPKIYNVNAVISDFPIFRNRYFGFLKCSKNILKPNFLIR